MLEATNRSNLNLSEQINSVLMAIQEEDMNGGDEDTLDALNGQLNRLLDKAGGKINIIND